MRAGAVQLHGFGVDLAGPGDADVILGEQAIHGGDVAIQRVAVFHCSSRFGDVLANVPAMFL